MGDMEQPVLGDLEDKQRGHAVHPLHEQKLRLN